MAEAVDVYGAGRRAVAGAGHPFARRRAGRADAAAASPARWPTGRSGSRSSAPPIRSTGRAAGSSSCPTRRSCSARSTRPRVLAERRRRSRSPSTTTSTGRPAPSTATAARRRRDFVYLFLGEGLGCAVVSDGEVRRGHAGLAGEIAHVVTAGPDGVAMPLTEVFAALGLRRPGIDRDRRAGAAAAVGRRTPRSGHGGPRRGRRALGRGRADRPGGRAGRRALGPASERAGRGRARVRGRAARTSRSRPPPSTTSRR